MEHGSPAHFKDSAGERCGIIAPRAAEQDHDIELRDIATALPSADH